MLQFLLSVVTLPIAKLLPPSVLYQPAIAPSPAALLVAVAAAVLSSAAAYFLWFDRIAFDAQKEQQREAEAQS
jgi:hypothetical protein